MQRLNSHISTVSYVVGKSCLLEFVGESNLKGFNEYDGQTGHRFWRDLTFWGKTARFER